MQFLTVSDEIVPAVYSLNIRERFAGVQCVLACGDLPYYYLEFIITTLAVPCYYVFGNHDRPEQTGAGEEVHAPRGCISLEGRSIYHDGILLAGMGGSIRYNSEAGPQYSEFEQQVRLMSLVPQLLFNRLRYGRYLDIFLTHSPPHGIHNGPDRPHQGFHGFLTFMRMFRPRYLIHGHIHKSYGFSQTTETRYFDTLVINTAGHRLLSFTPP
jgi:Icc-related predicted phosphoesterase